MRYRVEIYDANKSHDLTLYYTENLNRAKITNIVKENLKRFQGTIKAYVVDTKENKKIFAAYFPEEIHSLI
jgi:hypothetical protein